MHPIVKLLLAACVAVPATAQSPRPMDYADVFRVQNLVLTIRTRSIFLVMVCVTYQNIRFPLSKNYHQVRGCT